MCGHLLFPFIIPPCGFSVFLLLAYFTILNYKKQKILSIISLCINAILPIILLTIYQNNILIIVYPTIICVDVLIIIESLKKGDEKNERKDY